MPRGRLGRTGVSVSKLCLGAMMFGENSLRRLGTDWIDLYRSTGTTPIPILMGRSARSATWCERKGPLIGHSAFPVSAIVEGQWTAKERARERFVCEQPPYSILIRGIEADVLLAVAAGLYVSPVWAGAVLG